MDELREQHDTLLAKMKSDLSAEEYASLVEDHAASCPFCNENLVNDDPDERGDMEKTFTQAEVETLIADAVAPVQAELDGIKTSAATEAQEAAIAEVKTAAEAEVTAAKAETDVAVAEATAAKTELANLIAFLEAEVAAAEEAAAIAQRKDERVAAVKEVASFSDEHIAKRSDEWAAQSDEEFAALLEDLKAVPSTSTATEGEITDPLETAMDSTRKTSGSAASVFKDLITSRVNLNTI